MLEVRVELVRLTLPVCKHRIEVAFRARMQDMELEPQRAGRHLHALARNLDPRPVVVGRRRTLDAGCGAGFATSAWIEDGWDALFVQQQAGHAWGSTTAA